MTGDQQKVKETGERVNKAEAKINGSFTKRVVSKTMALKKRTSLNGGRFQAAWRRLIYCRNVCVCACVCVCVCGPSASH